MTVPVNDDNVVAFVNTFLHSIATTHPGADQPLIDAANSLNGPNSGPVPSDPITQSKLVELILNQDYASLSVQQSTVFNTLLSLQSIEIGSDSIQGKLAAIFVGYPGSLARISAAATRPGSGWEVYFGNGQSADITTIDNARNSGSGNRF